MPTNRSLLFRWIAPLLLVVVATQGLADAVGAVEPPSTAVVASPPPNQVTELQGVTVTGVQPGPGLWKVSKGDHVLWVLGTLDVLPKGMQWKALDVNAAIADSQQVLDEPRVIIDANVGFFAAIGMLPSLIGIRNNPDGKHLLDVVPPDQYAHWLVLKAKYLGSDGGVEKQRPIFAARALFIAALKKADLAQGMIDPVIKRAAKQHDLTPTPIVYTAPLDQPKTVLKDFKKGQLNDGDCFASTLDHLDTDVALTRARANAWATGDLDTLRGLPLSDRLQVCLAALTQSSLSQKQGLTGVEAGRKSAWVEAASKALAGNRATFAELPIDSLLGQSSYLTALQAQGATVTPPEGLTDDASGHDTATDAVVPMH